MRQEKTRKFDLESRKYELQGSCDCCVHFLPAMQTCSLFWPNAHHLLGHMQNEKNSHISFCKEFELN